MTSSAFRHRDFALFWVSLVTEALALQMAVVAIGWQVYSVRENPLDLGLVGLAEFLPLLLLALPAGNLADRIPRRHLLAFTLTLAEAYLAGQVTEGTAAAAFSEPRRQLTASESDTSSSERCFWMMSPGGAQSWKA